MFFFYYEVQEMKMKKIILALLSTLSIFMLISCSTTVSSTVTRPAELDMHGARTIAILPFQEYSPSGFLAGNSSEKDRKECCDYISTELEERLADVEYYTLESSTRVKVAIEKGRTPPVEVYITGYINRFNDKVSVSEHKSKNDDDEEIIEYVYTRDIDLDLVYQIVDATSNVVLHKNSKSFNASDRAYSKRTLKPAFDLIRPDLDSFVSDLLKKIQPYEEKVYYTLLESKSKDPEMKLAMKLANNNQIDAACDKFLSIYEETGDFTAGYNAAILLEAMGDLHEARDIMKYLADETADKRALKALKNINNEIELSEKLEQQNANRLF